MCARRRRRRTGAPEGRRSGVPKAVQAKRGNQAAGGARTALVAALALIVAASVGYYAARLLTQAPSAEPEVATRRPPAVPAASPGRRLVEEELDDVPAKSGIDIRWIEQNNEARKMLKEGRIADAVAAFEECYAAEPSFDIGAYIGGGIISLGSLVGFFTVLGISARNGIMLINHYQHLERYEGVAFGPELVLRGARERIAPILMTASTTGLALVPLVIAGNIPGHEIEHPLAIVILGGLVTSTMLNLLIVPPLYLMVGRFGRDGSSLSPDSVSVA